MFHKFANQGERRSYGGSGFLELQYCKMENGTSEKKIVSVNSIHHWQDDSLYVFADDIEQFLQDYIDIFATRLLKFYLLQFSCNAVANSHYIQARSALRQRSFYIP